jgi:hypothetical protein
MVGTVARMGHNVLLVAFAFISLVFVLQTL